jgi:DUF4097 and DUF4098 domain-containing protein YvlB
MKRTSLVAPLLLIGIGLLFLARNLYPELPLLDYLARYWPFLLILWGSLRLVEIFIWAATDKPLPRAGVSGGEWVLVIFLCVIGFSVHAVHGINNWWPRTGITVGGLDMFGESYEYPIAAEKAVSKTPHIVIESFRGNARITGVDMDSVKVTGHRTVRSFDQGGADRANRDSTFELAGDNNNVIVRTNQDRISGNMRLTADMEIMVPKGASVEAHGRYGDFDINDVAGAVEITSDNAGVRLQNIGGDARINLSRSDVIRIVNVKGLVDIKGRGADVDLDNVEGPVTLAGSYSGVIQFRNLQKPVHYRGERTDFSVEKIPGQVRMSLSDMTASNLVGPIHLTGKSRDVRMSDFSNGLELQMDRGDIELRPGVLPLSKMDVHTSSGDIELAVPASAKFDLNASTARGDITNDYGPPLRAESQGRGAELRGSAGGGASITLRSERGQVVVRKASADDKPFTQREDTASPREPKESAEPAAPAPSKPLKKVEQ